MHDLARFGPIDLVIAGWPCQGHTWVGRGEGLHDPMSHVLGDVAYSTTSLVTPGSRSSLHSGERSYVG